MIVKSVEINKFRSFDNQSFKMGKYITALAGKNATQKTTLLGMIGQPFTISQKDHPLYGCQTIDGYNFRSQFKDKFKLSQTFDLAGMHNWTLNFYNNNYYNNNKLELKSIPRPLKSNPNAIRFWNAESKSKGSGYVQLPVYFLSLSRLFPIGESGKTKSIDIKLSIEENDYFIENYRKILSIQSQNNANAVMEKADTKKNFVGINDDVHDVFTNSAGESNIGKIILAVLSFKRLKNQFGTNYKGGMLLIDELDATLYGYSQIKLIEYLYQSAKELKIQIVFTTHSPLILEKVGLLQKQEKKDAQQKGINTNIPDYNYNGEIVYLKPDYKKNLEGAIVRKVKCENIRSVKELKKILNDINLEPTLISQDLHVYVEDERAKSFLEFLLKNYLKVNINNYLNIIDVDLGYTNYLQLYSKKIPEFLNSVIILDHDVLVKASNSQKQIIVQSNNIILLPDDVERGMFDLLKDPTVYSHFENELEGIQMDYETCFRDFPLDKYQSLEYKQWFKYIENIVKDVNILFKFWLNYNIENANQFINQFIDSYNYLADKFNYDNLNLPIE